MVVTLWDSQAVHVGHSWKVHFFCIHHAFEVDALSGCHYNSSTMHQSLIHNSTCQMLLLYHLFCLLSDRTWRRCTLFRLDCLLRIVLEFDSVLVLAFLSIRWQQQIADDKTKKSEFYFEANFIELFSTRSLSQVETHSALIPFSVVTTATVHYNWQIDFILPFSIRCSFQLWNAFDRVFFSCCCTKLIDCHIDLRSMWEWKRHLLSLKLNISLCFYKNNIRFLQHKALRK